MLEPGRPCCRTAAAAACCCYCCWTCLLLLLLPIIVVLLLLLCASVEAFVYSVCTCSRTDGASSCALGEWHASCDILLSLRCYSCGCCGCCGCCECFYVLPPPLLLLLLSVVMDF